MGGSEAAAAALKEQQELAASTGAADKEATEKNTRELKYRLSEAEKMVKETGFENRKLSAKYVRDETFARCLHAAFSHPVPRFPMSLPFASSGTGRLRRRQTISGASCRKRSTRARPRSGARRRPRSR